jgi:hypothetical protein
VAGRALLSTSPDFSETDKPNGHSELVDPLANSPTACQPFASDSSPFAATLSSKESGEVADAANGQPHLSNCEPWLQREGNYDMDADGMTRSIRSV